MIFTPTFTSPVYMGTEETTMMIQVKSLSFLLEAQIHDDLIDRLISLTACAPIHNHIFYNVMYYIF